jgi:hypothetical protein
MDQVQLFTRFSVHTAGFQGWSKLDGEGVVVWCDIHAPDEHLACWLAVSESTRRAAERVLREAGVHRLKLLAPSRPPISDDLLRLAVATPGRVTFQISDGASPAGVL